jgi:hypothetical protein
VCTSTHVGEGSNASEKGGFVWSSIYTVSLKLERNDSRYLEEVELDKMEKKHPIFSMW